jgi:hypothetical protein
LSSSGRLEPLRRRDAGLFVEHGAEVAGERRHAGEDAVVLPCAGDFEQAAVRALEADAVRGCRVAGDFGGAAVGSGLRDAAIVEVKLAGCFADHRYLVGELALPRTVDHKGVDLTALGGEAESGGAGETIDEVAVDEDSRREPMSMGSPLAAAAVVVVAAAAATVSDCRRVKERSSEVEAAG